MILLNFLDYNPFWKKRFCICMKFVSFDTPPAFMPILKRIFADGLMYIRRAFAQITQQNTTYLSILQALYIYSFNRKITSKLGNSKLDLLLNKRLLRDGWSTEILNFRQDKPFVHLHNFWVLLPTLGRYACMVGMSRCRILLIYLHNKLLQKSKKLKKLAR